MRLVTPDLALLDAAIAGAIDGMDVAAGWAVFEGALPRTREALARDPDAGRWGTRLFVLDDPPTLVGWGGFKGPPGDGGVVEIGYAIAPAHRGRGIACAAVREMLREAGASGNVSAVIAHTLAEPNASTRVLERTGFARDGEGPDGAWRWLRRV
jgi:RimJ/RimL family protein N-acetyltransferase